MVLRERFARELGGFAEPQDAGNVLRAGTEAALMMAAVEKLAEMGATANVESADALWGVKLVAGNGEKVDAESVHVNGKLSGGLNGVGVEIDIRFFGDVADFLERLDGSELIVGVHDGD